MNYHAGGTSSRAKVEAGLLIAIIFVFAMQEGMLAPALPAILKQFGMSPAHSGWLTSANILGIAVLTPLLGRFGDLWDKAWVVFCTAVVAALGSIICLNAPSFTVLLIGQAMIGLSYALHPLAVGLMAELLPAEKVPTAVGGVIGAAIGGTTLGLLGSGPVVSAFGVFGLYSTPLAVALVLITGLGFVSLRLGPGRHAVRNNESLDWLGALLLAVTTLLLMFGLVTGPQEGWGTPKPLLLLFGAGAVLYLWLQVERRHRSPMLDPRLFMSRGLSLVCVLAVTSGAGSVGPAMLIPLLMQADASSGAGLGLDVTDTGMFLLPMGLAACAVAPLGGLLRKSLDNRGCLILAALAILAGNLMLYLWHGTATQIAVGMLFVGAGIGLASAETMNAVVSLVENARVASASSAMYVSKSLGTMAASQICAGFLGAATNPVTGQTAYSGYAASFVFCVAICVVGVAAAFLFRPGSPTRLVPLEANG